MRDQSRSRRGGIAERPGGAGESEGPLMNHLDAKHPTAHERFRAVVSRQPYPLIFATISVAHLYGFPSPDSDYDLRGVHLLPAEDALGLDAGRETIESSTDESGAEVDLVTHDARKF